MAKQVLAVVMATLLMGCLATDICADANQFSDEKPLGTNLLQIAAATDDIREAATLAPPACTDLEWKDKYNAPCWEYVGLGWCTSSGGQTGQLIGSFDDYASNGITAVEACCGCGGGVRAATPAPAVSTGDGKVGANGDPHLVNIHGQRFDIMHPGVHVLLEIPRASWPEGTLLRVEADAQAFGATCADMYFQSLKIVGRWTQSAAGGEHGLLFNATSSLEGGTTGWLTFGRADLKVVHGHTAGGIKYLNFFVKHLNQVGYAVGGLLGDDDHSTISTPPAMCKQTIDLFGTHVEASHESDGSVAEANAF